MEQLTPNRCIVVAIRDYPDMPLEKHRHSYIVGFSPFEQSAIKMANDETKERGGKYGCIVLDCETGTEVYTIGRNEPI